MPTSRAVAPALPTSRESLNVYSGEIDDEVVTPARSDGLWNLSAAAETPVSDSNVAQLRQHVDGIGVAGDQCWPASRLSEISRDWKSQLVAP